MSVRMKLFLEFEQPQRTTSKACSEEQFIKISSQRLIRFAQALP